MSNKLLNETEGKVPGRKCPPIYFIPRARKWCHLHFFETHDHQHFSPAARMALSHTDHMQAQCLETGMAFGWALLGESLAFCPALNIQKLLTNQERFSSPNSVWHLWVFFSVLLVSAPLPKSKVFIWSSSKWAPVDITGTPSFQLNLDTCW